MEPGGASRAAVCLLLRRLLLLMLIAIVGPTTTTPTRAHAHQPAAGSSAHTSTAARSRAHAPPAPAWETAQTGVGRSNSSASAHEAVAPGLHKETHARDVHGAIKSERAARGAVATVTALQLRRRRRAGAVAIAASEPASASAAAPGPSLSESRQPSLLSLGEPLLSAYSDHERAVQLRLISTPSSTTFLARMAQEYHIIRPEVEMLVQPVATSEAAFDLMARGAADVAISSLIPTSEDLQRAPDIAHLPLWAYAYAPIINVPAMEGLDMVLSLPLVCRIFGGKVTHWNDSAIVDLNPQLAAATAPIEVVLLGSDLSYILDFTALCGVVDADFAATVPPSSRPLWPQHRYARSRVEYGMTGPASYVVATPNTIALVLSSYARKLGATIASMLNLAGAIVNPSYAAVDSAVRTRALQATRDMKGKLHYTFSNELSNAPGKSSWPLNAAAMMAIPRTFTRTTCRAQSELIKFLRWVLDDSSVRYTIGQKEDAVLLPEEVGKHIGLRATLDATRCHAAPVNVDSAFLIRAGGDDVATTHTRARTVFMNEYSAHDASHVTVEDSVQDPAGALQAITDPHHPLDIVFFFPQVYRRMYPGQLEALAAARRVRFMPAAAHGLVPTYSFAVETVQALATADALPLKLDMETLGGIFTGAIRSWTDPALVGFNLALGSVFAGAAASESGITLVLYSGDQNNVAQSALSNALVLSLSKTRAVLDSGLAWGLPADWRPVTARLDALGARYVTVRSEAEMEAAVARIPGAVGYKLAFSNASNPETDFAIVRFVQPALEAAAGATAEALQPYNVTVLGVPESFGACAAAAKPTSGGELDLQAVGWSAAPSAAHCWPMVLVVAIALPADMHVLAAVYTADAHLQSSSSSTAASGSQSLERLCAAQRRVAHFAEYMLFDSGLGRAEWLSGYYPLAEVPWLRETMRAELNGVFCGGKPIMYTPAIVWQLADAVRVFAQAVAAAFIVLAVVAGALVLKYRARTIIRSGDLPLQLTMLTGLVMLLICPLLFVAAPDAAVCRSLGYLLCLGFSLAFGPIVAKIWRVHATFKQRRSLKIRRISARTLYAIVGALVAVDAVLLASQNSKGALLVPGTVSHLKDSHVLEHHQCSTSSGALPIAGTLIGVKILLLLVTSVLAFGVRHVSSAFDESANLSWAVWNTALSAAILVPILVLVGEGAGDVHTFLLVFLLLWIAASTLIFSFGYKLAALLSEEWRSAAEASRLSRTSRTSKQTSNTSGTGTGTGTGSGSTNSAFQLPTLSEVSLFVLEKYMIALESQLRLAKEQRRAEFGANYVAAKSFGLSAPSSTHQQQHSAQNSGNGDSSSTAQHSSPKLGDQQQQQQQLQPHHPVANKSAHTLYNSAAPRRRQPLQISRPEAAASPSSSLRAWASLSPEPVSPPPLSIRSAVGNGSPPPHPAASRSLRIPFNTRARSTSPPLHPNRSTLTSPLSPASRVNTAGGGASSPVVQLRSASALSQARSLSPQLHSHRSLSPQPHRLSPNYLRAPGAPSSPVAFELQALTPS